MATIAGMEFESLFSLALRYHWDESNLVTRAGWSHNWTLSRSFGEWYLCD
jgi:hypothetical protein